MSGGGPPGHHPHGRQVPPSNSAWNHLQVPNYFPRQPQHAHMSNEPGMLQHQPTWHTPTPDPTSVKSAMPPTSSHHLQYQQQQHQQPQPHHHHHHKMGVGVGGGGVGGGGSSAQMTGGIGGHPEWPQYHHHQQQQRRPPVVDLSLTRNGSGQQNGEQQQQQQMAQLPPASPISLSVRDANRINSLPPGALEIQTAAPPMITVETPPPPPPQVRAQAASPKTLSPGLMQQQQQDGKGKRAPGKRVDSILERLNPAVQAAVVVSTPNDATPPPPPSEGGILMTITTAAAAAAATASSSSHDENSNSSGILNVPTPNSNNDDVVSPYSNDDSLDGGSKSRRKRKPSKTVRLTATSIDDQDLAPAPQQQTRAGAAAVPLTVTEAAHPLVSFKEAMKEQQQQQQSEEAMEEIAVKKVTTTKKVTERRRSGGESRESRHHQIDSGGGGGGGGGGSEGGRGQEEVEETETPAANMRRKASSEAETIDDIAAMVREGLREREGDADFRVVSVIRGTTGNNKDGSAPTTPLKEASEIVAALSDTPVKNADTNPPTSTPQQQPPPKFVEVENKLEEMFAGIEDTSDPMKSSLDSDASKDASAAAPSTSIEDELLKMEASSTAASSQQDVTSTSNDLVATPTKKSPKKGKRKQQKRSLRRSTNDQSTAYEPANPSPNKKQKTASAAVALSGSGKKTSNKFAPATSATTAATSKQQQQTGGGGTTTTKGSLKKVGGTAKLDLSRDVYAYDSGSNASSSRSRGPFIQIKGPRDSPLSVSVVNTPTNDDDPDHKRPHHHKAKKYHDDSEYRHKVRSKGLHCSTLSHQYDAQTKDASWMCAFCKRGPHAIETTGPSHPGGAAPGDLFGPYLITGNSPAFERRLDDPFDKQFKSKKIARALDAAAQLLHNQKTTTTNANLKKKRKYSDAVRGGSSLGGNDSDDVIGHYLGIAQTGEGESKYEIWAHEDCIVWSQGTYLVGPKIVGLEEAVWTSCNVTCTVCQLRGANICCLRRGCTTGPVHVCCARQTGWQFDEGDYKTLCPGHRTIEHDP